VKGQPETMIVKPCLKLPVTDGQGAKVLYSTTVL